MYSSIWSVQALPSRERSMNVLCGSDIDSPPRHGVFHQISGDRVERFEVLTAPIEDLNFPTERVPGYKCLPLSLRHRFFARHTLPNTQIVENGELRHRRRHVKFPAAGTADIETERPRIRSAVSASSESRRPDQDREAQVSYALHRSSKNAGPAPWITRAPLRPRGRVPVRECAASP
jgi:hypothetical protein